MIHRALMVTTWALAVALVALPVVALVNGWIGAERWPLRTLRVTDGLERVDTARLREVVAPHAAAGFFAVRLDRAQAEVARLPWVERAEVRKLWPDVLEVRIVEHRPFARWGQDRLLSEQGRLFPVEGIEVPAGLPLLHGPHGEDGTVQGLLELAAVPYVGSGVLASALCMDKVKAKEILGAHGLPQGSYLALRDTELDGAAAAVAAAGLAYPLFVKPSNMGSSVGVSKVAAPAGLDNALAVAAGYDEWIVVEEGVVAREIEVGVLGNADARASVPGEIVSSHEFYDYEDKYLDGTSNLVIPAALDDETTARVRSLALEAYQVLRCDGLARVDFFLEEEFGVEVEDVRDAGQPHP